jgi:predicted anti-sigma-YlaC factor YlaD
MTDSSDRCEACEMSISALLDGEEGKDETLPLLDHLVGCPSCQAFYREARALDVSLKTGPAAATEPAPEALWKRIERRGFAANEWRSWAPRLAAALLVALGAVWAAHSLGAGAAGGPIEIVLGQGGSMTDRHFVEITAEVLRSDPRYRQEMLRVMSAVAAEAGPRETPADQDPVFDDESAPDHEDRGPARATRRAT